MNPEMSSFEDLCVKSVVKDMSFQADSAIMSAMKDMLMSNVEQLGRAIRLRRQERGLSQISLAQRLGVDRKWVIHLEAGNPRAEFGLVLKALEALSLDAYVHDESLPPTMQRPAAASRLDEVFRRVQRTERK
jgi:ribosome-binding protein aMBF1 (putative translation factor)